MLVIVKKAKKRHSLCQFFQKAHSQTLQAYGKSLLKDLKSAPLFQKASNPNDFDLTMFARLHESNSTDIFNKAKKVKSFMSKISKSPPANSSGLVFSC